MAPLIVGCATRPVAHSLIVDCKAVTRITILINDWARTLGKPRRIIMDNGSPGMFGTEWGEISHTYATQLVHAPKSASYQNGLSERVVRSHRRFAIDSLCVGYPPATEDSHPCRYGAQSCSAHNRRDASVAGDDWDFRPPSRTCSHRLATQS